MSLNLNPNHQLHIDAISGADTWWQILNLLDQSFQVPQGMHFFDDFPVWNPRLKIDDRKYFGVFKGRLLVSVCAIRLTEIKRTDQGSIPIAILGGLATHSEWRGMGLASQVVSTAVQWANEMNAQAVILWSSEHRLYSRLGFRNFGNQVQIPLEKFHSHSIDPILVKSGWNSFIYPILQQRPDGLRLKSQDRQWFEAHKNVQWYWVGDTPENPVAYAAIGRGIDLGNIVHEWGGSIEILKGLLRYIHSLNPGSSLLCSPAHLKSLGIGLDSESIADLGLVKVFDNSSEHHFDDKLWIWGLDAG